MTVKHVLAQFGLHADECKVISFGSGLINKTWKVECAGNEYILQRVNHHVFLNPADIDANINRISAHLSRHHPDYLFTSPVTSPDGRSLVVTADRQYFRMFHFIKDSVSFDIANTPQIAFDAAKQFGKFTHLLADLPGTDLAITLPDFHNLLLRQKQFETAIQNANPGKLGEAELCIKELMSYRFIPEKFEAIIRSPFFRKRITHHDTKISNILFDRQGRGLCVIDLDTVMPGYFISDIGDMIRTYVCPVNEEETDFNRIHVRENYFAAILDGYLSEMKDELTDQEMDHFAYAGQFMIYMQAIRFMTDHLENDRYYGARYKGHNLVRAGNQTVLLRKLNEKMPQFEGMLVKYRQAAELS